MVDSIGNNDAAFVGGALPEWTGNALVFRKGKNISLPPALNDAKTFYFSLYIAPLTSGVQETNVSAPLLTSSTGTDGLNIVLATPNALLLKQSEYTYSPTLYNHGPSTSAINLMSGFGVITVVCGNGSDDPDRIYIDAVEVTYASQHGNCASQRSGNLYLGPAPAKPWQDDFLPGTLYGFGASFKRHTPAQIQQNVDAFYASAAQSGIPTTPRPMRRPLPEFLAVGDSFSSGTNGQKPYFSELHLTNQPIYEVVNLGIPGIKMAAIASHESHRAAQRCSTLSGDTVAVLSAGADDLASIDAASPTEIWNEDAAWASLMRKAGCLPFIVTMISHDGHGYSGKSLDALKNIYNALIRQQALKVGFAGILDVAANPALGADEAYKDPKYFRQSPEAGLTSLGNHAIADAVSNGLNRYFGYDDAFPRIVSDLAQFKMQCDDGVVELDEELDELKASGSLVLPDCTGAAGREFKIRNNSNTLSVTVESDSGRHPFIAGEQVARSVSVNPRQTCVLTIEPNRTPASDWHWFTAVQTD